MKEDLPVSVVFGAVDFEDLNEAKSKQMEIIIEINLAYEEARLKNSERLPHLAVGAVGWMIVVGGLGIAAEKGGVKEAGLEGLTMVVSGFGIMVADFWYLGRRESQRMAEMYWPRVREVKGALIEAMSNEEKQRLEVLQMAEEIRLEELDLSGDE